ncbi:substrate-binding domain-containing protein [Streptomyces roseirectus]|uniref:Substrate-binding domain-containing protein n=1 Tax=Streptomyces roseirectus TaxID=2768066 RepID=A0A7H0IDD0_9ACTN|nr:caspase family protein [Streptomyces roseirectus]QNP70796.1 substrate-binding domain-containing protein [Streptomyces roseirectus]
MSGFDPRDRGNRALIVGVDTYDHIRTGGDENGVAGSLPAVKDNREQLEDVLRRSGVFPPDGDCVRVKDSPSQDEFSEALRKVTQDTEGLLLFYFAGHGVVPVYENELFLQMRNARVLPGDAFPGAVRFSDVLAELAASRAKRVLVILDCCYAGNAASIWSRLDDHRRRREILLLMSVQPNRLQTDRPINPGGPTPFTHELVQVLGVNGELWLSGLYEELKRRMRVANVPLPVGKDVQAPQAEWEQGEDVLLGAAGVPGPMPQEEPGGLERPVYREPGKRAFSVRQLVRRVTRLSLTLLLTLAATAAGAFALFVLVGDDPACAPPLHLRVLTDPDLEPALTAAAHAYTASGANSEAGCRSTGIGVYSARAADVVTALRRSTDPWQRPKGNEDPQRDIGPQPDVWVPATRADIDRVTLEQDDRTFAHLDPADGPLAYSPVVLATPATGFDARTSSSLVRMIGESESRGAEVRRPDPEFTDSALLATQGLYADSGDARAGERLVADSGQLPRTAAESLCADTESAVLVPEFALQGACPQGVWVPRTALYPNDVPGLAPTFVRVTWDDGDRDAAARAAAVSRFRSWLGGADGRAVLGAHGFRSPEPGHRLLGAAPPGVLPEPGDLGRLAEASAMGSALDRYRNARGPGQVLFLLDSSGSMDNLWQGASGGPGLVQQSLGGLGEKDTYGVWAVAGTSGANHAEVLPFKRHKRGDAEKALSALQRAGVRDAEADPRGALRDALAFMRRQGTDTQLPQLIVYLTDDEDNSRLSGRDLDDLLGIARESGVPVTMVSLATGGCEAGRADALISVASEGRCLDPGDDLAAALRDEVGRTGTGEE